MLTPYVIARLVFVLLMPSGTSVPYSRKPRLVLGLVGLCLLIHIATQLVELLSGAGGAMKLLAAAVPDGEGGFGRYIEALGVVPARLRVEGGAQWSQLLTASLVHLDWLHFLFNAWCLVIFAINLEDLFGRARFALFAVAGNGGVAGRRGVPVRRHAGRLRAEHRPLRPGVRVHGCVHGLLPAVAGAPDAGHQPDVLVLRRVHRDARVR